MLRVVLGRPRELGRAGHWAERERKRRSGPAGFGIFGLGFGPLVSFPFSTSISKQLKPI